MESAKPTAIRGRHVIFVTAGLLCVALLISLPVLRIAYHRWQLDRGKAYMEGAETGWGLGELLWVDEFNGYTGDMTHFEHHLQCLVKLGAVRHQTYELDHILMGHGADEGSHLFKKVYDLPSIHVTSPYSERPEPMVLEVFSEWSDATTWDDFVATHDVPNYRRRFMRDAESSTNDDEANVTPEAAQPSH